MPSTREQLRQATRRRVVDTAGRLFRERGFATTTIRDIAEASGVSVGTVMAAGDKNSLLVQVFDELITAEHVRRGDADAIPEPGAGSSCVDRVMELVRPFVTLFTGRLDLARAYASILVSGDHESALFAGLAERLVEEIRETITRHGCTPAEDAAAKAEAFYLAYVGALFTWSARSTADPTALDDGLRTTFTAICTCEERPR